MRSLYWGLIMVLRAWNILQAWLQSGSMQSGKQESEHDSYGRLMAHNLSFVWSRIKSYDQKFDFNAFINGCKVFFEVGNELISESNWHLKSFSNSIEHRLNFDYTKNQQKNCFQMTRAICLFVSRQIVSWAILKCWSEFWINERMHCLHTSKGLSSAHSNEKKAHILKEILTHEWKCRSFVQSATLQIQLGIIGTYATANESALTLKYRFPCIKCDLILPDDGII